MNVPGHFSLQGAMKVSDGSSMLSSDRKVMSQKTYVSVVVVKWFQQQAGEILH